MNILRCFSNRKYLLKIFIYLVYVVLKFTAQISRSQYDELLGNHWSVYGKFWPVYPLGGVVSMSETAIIVLLLLFYNESYRKTLKFIKMSGKIHRLIKKLGRIS